MKQQRYPYPASPLLAKGGVTELGPPPPSLVVELRRWRDRERQGVFDCDEDKSKKKEGNIPFFLSFQTNSNQSVNFSHKSSSFLGSLIPSSLPLSSSFLCFALCSCASCITPPFNCITPPFSTERDNTHTRLRKHTQTPLSGALYPLRARLHTPPDDSA